MLRKIGFDFHGVINSDPELFSILSQDLFSMGWDIYILTGSTKESIIEYLKNWNIKYNYIFSISNYYKEQGAEIHYDEKGNFWIEEKLWNKAKGEFCKREQIALHIDNSKEYQEYFKTNFALFYSNT